MLLSFGEVMARKQVKDRGFFGTNKLGFTCDKILQIAFYARLAQFNAMVAHFFFFYIKDFYFYENLII